MVDIIPAIVQLQPGSASDETISILGKRPGNLDVTALINPSSDIR